MAKSLDYWDFLQVLIIKFLEVVDAGEVEVLYGEGVDVRLQGAQQGGEVKEGGLNIVLLVL